MNEILSFGQRYREAKLKNFNLHKRAAEVANDYRSLPQRKEQFVLFVREEGLSAISTPEQYNRKKEEMTQKIEAMPITEAVDFLEELRRQAVTGRRLTQETNIYLRAKGKAGKAPEQLTDEELRGLGDQVELPSPWADVENRFGTLREHDDFVHPLVAKRSGQKGNYPQKEASFALHREALMMQSLSSSLTSEFHAGMAVRLGVTGHQYEKYLMESGSVDRLIKRFAFIPDVMADWKQNGLMDFNVHINNWNGTLLRPERKPEFAEKALTILFPDGKERYQEYKEAEFTKWKKQKNPDKIWFELRKKMYDTLVDGFSQADTFAHPLIEEQARKLAVYVLSASDNPVNAAHDSKFQMGRLDRKPLAESVKVLKRLGYEEGLDQLPLLKEMRKKIVGEGLNPQKIAEKLEAVNQRIQDLRPYYHNVNLWDLGDGYSQDWFVKETFCKISTLDDEGKYTPKDHSPFHLRAVKPPEAAQNIIDALRGMEK